jgi:tetratricopeptide (TPR) repeat protein
MPGGDPPIPPSKLDATHLVRPRRPDPHPTPRGEPLPVAVTPQASAGLPGVPFPEPGDWFLHFELVKEIGRGSFAHVFLARQESLAHRLVVLKVTTAQTDEPQNLARLQHTNVVPVYSVHNAGPLQALCMPYLGEVTLAQILATLDGTPKDQRANGGVLLAPVAAAAPADAPALADAVAALAKLSFVEGCVWFVGQLAAGLGHAHARHILHRDLKPGNVLVTSDGVPMLLDFNVSCESARGADGMLGGTLAYMAPEHLRAFLDPAVAVDERGDLYSLGVILYELLTGRQPYPLPEAVGAADALPARIAQHAEPPPPPSRFNPSVPPAVDAIALKLLAPDPADRYACAADIREDATRQLAARPLKFARNASAVERVAKWRRRNPGLAAAALALAAVVVPAVVVAARQADLVARTGQLQRAEADGRWAAAVADLKAAEAMLGSHTDAALRGHGLDLAQGVLAGYGVAQDAGWESRPAVALLAPDRRAELKARFANASILMARATAGTPDGLPTALAWNRLAGRLFADADRPAVVARHRAEFEARLGGRPVPRFAAPDPATARPADLYFDGLDLAAAGRPAEALPLLARACDRDPTRFLAWFARGMCHDALNQPAEAVTAFAVAAALRPESPFPHANRGVALVRLRRFAEAEADLTRALDLKPGWGPALLNRGTARDGLRRPADAAADYTAALADPAAPTRLYFLRSRARRAAGDAAGADADRAEGLARTPTDALSWTARGAWRLAAKQPHEALADFDAALALNPTLRDALVNKAVVLADHLRREADAIPVLDELLTRHPSHADALGSRGVYHARLGRAAEAGRDAAAALMLDGSAYRHFQVAGVFAQLAKADPAGPAKDKAFVHLALAVKAGFADRALLESDPDLDPVRRDPRFDQVTAAARAIDRLGQ